MKVLILHLELNFYTTYRITVAKDKEDMHGERLRFTKPQDTQTA